MEYHIYDAYFLFSFLGHFWRENGRGYHSRPYLSGASKPDQKVGPLGGPFGPNHVFEIFRGEPPFLKLNLERYGL